MNNQQWKLPTIWDVIDRMTLSFLFPEEQKPKEKKVVKMKKTKKTKVKK